jgi:toxin ParE1/3/4
VTRRIQIERAAEADMAEITAEMREHRPASAVRFVAAAREAFAVLARHPEMGRRYQTTHPQLQQLRVWRVKGFEKYLIFYRAGRASIFIERVLYGGREIERLLRGQE